MTGGPKRTHAADALAAWTVGEGERTAREAHPELSVVTRTVVGRPEEELADATRTAGMLVLGDRSHRDSVALREGAVAVHVGPTVHTLLHHAECPVAVVPIS